MHIEFTVSKQCQFIPVTLNANINQTPQVQQGMPLETSGNKLEGRKKLLNMLSRTQLCYPQEHL